jgi:hypothetical protein
MSFGEETSPGSKIFEVRDFITISIEGKVVGMTKAQFDLSDIDDERVYDAALHILLHHVQCVNHHMLSDAALVKESLAVAELDDRKRKYDALPWHKRLLTRKPRRAFPYEYG